MNTAFNSAIPPPDVLLVDARSRESSLTANPDTFGPPEGLELHRADTLDRALDALAAAHFDMVVLAIGGGFAEGMAAITRLRGAAPHVPVVVVTTSIDDALRREASGLGAADVLAAAWESPLFGRSLLHVLERHRAAERSRLIEMLMDASSDPMVVVSHRGEGSLYVNPSARRLLDRCSRETTGDALDLLMRCHAPRVVGDPDGARTATSHAFRLDWRGERALVHVFRHDARYAPAVEENRTRADATRRELEAFSYSVAHDLRSPLRAIDGFSRALLEDHEAELDVTGRQHLARIRSGVQRMGHLIDDLLELSHVTRTDVRRSRTDLSALARRVIERLRQARPNPRAVYVVPDGLTADADRNLMEIALENLLGNAAKFSARRATPVIEFGVDLDGDEPAFFVRDNGAGFDQTYAFQLFRAFQRLHSSTEFEGTGIGLSLVKRIIERHGGRVWAVGAVDRGATFFFTLGPTSSAPSSAG